MILDKKTFLRGMQQLIYAFPNWNVKVDEKESMAVWYSFFQTMTDHRYNAMIKKYIENERAYPTVAGLMELGKSIPVIDNDTPANRAYAEQHNRRFDDG